MKLSPILVGVILLCSACKKSDSTVLQDKYSGEYELYSLGYNGLQLMQNSSAVLVKVSDSTYQLTRNFFDGAEIKIDDLKCSNDTLFVTDNHRIIYLLKGDKLNKYSIIGNNQNAASSKREYRFSSQLKKIK